MQHCLFLMYSECQVSCMRTSKTSDSTSSYASCCGATSEESVASCIGLFFHLYHCSLRTYLQRANISIFLYSRSSAKIISMLNIILQIVGSHMQYFLPPPAYPKNMHILNFGYSFILSWALHDICKTPK